MTHIEKLRTRLTVEQIEAAELLAVNRFLPRNPDEGEQGRLSYGEIAEKVDVSVRQLYRWRNYNEDFINYTNALASNAFMQHLPQILEKHLDMTLKGQGSMKGIELFYKYGGLLVDKSEVEQKGGDGASKEALEDRINKLRAERDGDEGDDS